MAKNKKKNKGPEHRNKNAQNSNPVKAAPKKAAEGQKSFFSNIVDSVKKLVKQSS